MEVRRMDRIAVALVRNYLYDEKHRGEDDGRCAAGRRAL